MEVSGNNALGRDAFLMLLTTQLKHQDPLAPMGSTEFVTQLAQFSQLEQMTGVNERLDTLVTGNAALTNYGATALIGKTVKVSGGSISLPADGGIDLSYRLAGEAAEVTIEIVDSGGKVVRILDAGGQAAGPRRVAWDGRDFDGNRLPEGRYRFNISAVDGEGKTVLSDRFGTGAVTGVVYEEGRPYLIVNEERVPAEDVVAVNQE